MNSIFTPHLVSLVVASYNHDRFLASRINGLLAQTYKNIEIIVIDDSSSDNSVEILRRYSSHSNFQLTEHKKNSGWVSVSNEGFAKSTGEYILFANCDDDCRPTLIQRLVEAMERYPSIGVSFCRSEMIDEAGIIMGNDYDVREKAFRKKCSNDVFIEGTRMHQYLMHSCVIPNLSGALIRASAFKNAGGFSFNFQACSDWDLFFKISKKSDFYYISEPLNLFRQHKKTIRSTIKSKVTYDEFFSILLTENKNNNYSFFKKMHHRHHVMYLWAIELLNPTSRGIINFWHHLRSVSRLDMLALLLLPFSLIGRVLEIIFKVCKKIFS